MEESKSRTPQFGSKSSFGLISSYELSTSSSGSFGMNSNSNSASFQALALEHQSGKVAVSVSESVSSDSNANTSPEAQIFSKPRQSSNHVTLAHAQHKGKEPPQKVLLPTPITWGPPPTINVPLIQVRVSAPASSEDLWYNPFRLRHSSKNKPPSATVAPTVKPPSAPVAQMVEPPSTEQPIQCPATSGSSSYQGKRKLQQCEAIDSPILQAQMGPEIVQNISLSNRKRVATAAQSNAPSNIYHNVTNQHEYADLFEKMAKGCHDIKIDPQYTQFQELTLDNQINQVVKFQTLTAEQHTFHLQLVHDTMSLLREYEPECEVYAFGSLITGLKNYSYSPGFQSVDLEFSVCLSPNFSRASHEVILNALVDSSYTFLSRSLSQDSEVIKLKHKLSNLTCELSFQGRLPKHDTSMLIKYYLEHSIETRSFLALLRHWARVHQIIGHETDNLSEYTVFMLGLVYLMKDKKQIQPVNVLVTKDIIKKSMIDCSNTTAGSKAHVNVGKHVLELFTEFCDKYAKLDFSSVVISPYAGKIIPRKLFKLGNHSRLPPTLRNVQCSWNELSLCTPICVQDPYVLEANICWDRNREATERLKHKCLETYDILSNKEKETFNLLDLFMSDCEKVEELPSLIMNTREKPTNCNKKVCSEPEKVESAIVIESASEMGSCGPATSVVNVNRKRNRKRKVKTNKTVPVEIKTKLVFSIDGVFVDLYLQEIGGSKILEELSGNLLKSKIFTLWKDFSMDFFNEMIMDGLKLSVSSDPKEKVVQVTYPFWQGRAELIQYGEKNPVEVENKQSDAIFKYFETNKQAGSNEKKSNADEFSDFVIPIKVDVMNKNKVPTLEIYIQNFCNQSDGISTAKESDHQSTVQCISRIFKRAFTLYLTYRIKRHTFQ